MGCGVSKPREQEESKQLSAAPTPLALQTLPDQTKLINAICPEDTNATSRQTELQLHSTDNNPQDGLTELLTPKCARKPVFSFSNSLHKKTAARKKNMPPASLGISDMDSSGLEVESCRESFRGEELLRVTPKPETARNRNLGPRTAGHMVAWKRGELIGAGTSGRVYMGLNEWTGQLMAVKEILCASETRNKEITAIKNEIDLMRSMRHPNIVQYLGTDVVGDNLLIFTEWVPGGSLLALQKKFGKLSETIVRNYTRQILTGLDYLHQQKVVHRDIKAANILVDDRGTIKLADFGSSKRIIDQGENTNGGETLKGTPYYLAPEVIEKQDHGPKADIWAVGCTIIQMVSGQHPWQSLCLESAHAIMFHIARSEGPPPLPTEISDVLRDFLCKCFERNSLLRPTAADLLQHPFLREDDDENPLSELLDSFEKQPSARITSAPSSKDFMFPHLESFSQCESCEPHSSRSQNTFDIPDHNSFGHADYSSEGKRQMQEQAELDSHVLSAKKTVSIEDKGERITKPPLCNKQWEPSEEANCPGLNHQSSEWVSATLSPFDLGATTGRFEAKPTSRMTSRQNTSRQAITGFCGGPVDLGRSDQHQSFRTQEHFLKHPSSPYVNQGSPNIFEKKESAVGFWPHEASYSIGKSVPLMGADHSRHCVGLSLTQQDVQASPMNHDSRPILTAHAIKAREALQWSNQENMLRQERKKAQWESELQREFQLQQAQKKG